MAKLQHEDRALFAVRQAAHKAGSPVSDGLALILAVAVLSVLPQKEWFAVSCKHQQEKRAAEELRNQGFRVFHAKVFRHPEDEDFGIYGAMGYRIPGYLFVEATRADFPAIESTKGVESLVYGAAGGERKAMALPPGTIERLRKFEDEDFAHATMKRPDARDDLREGAQVVVDDKDHPVYGHSGTLMFLDAKVAKVLIGGMHWPVEPAFLKKVEPPKKAKKKIEQPQQKRAA